MIGFKLSPIVLAISVVLAFTATPAEAIQSCKAKVNRKTGVITASASQVGATPHWGAEPNTIDAEFFNESTCFAKGKLSGCTLADPATPAARLTPSLCVIFIEDASGQLPCAAIVEGCRASPEDRGGDFVIQIDMDRALAGGVTRQDTPGFPVTLSDPGTYRLSGNLDVTAFPSPEHISVIEVAASDVTIDLAGFSILGGCYYIGCPTGTGRGIYRSTSDARTRVFGGTVTGMGGTGIELGQGAIVRDVIVHRGYGDAITLGAHGSVSDCIVSLNSGQGISVGAGASIEGNVVIKNGSFGIGLDRGAVRGNVVSENAGTGISCGEECVAERNYSYANSTGLRMQTKGLARHNVAANNEGNGIESNRDSLVVGNVSAGNGGYGLVGPLGLAYSENLLLKNASGPTDAGLAVQLGGNACPAGLCP